MFGWKVGYCLSVTAAAFLIVAWSVGAQSKLADEKSDGSIVTADAANNSGSNGNWDYKFTEIVQVKVIGGVPRPQFALIYRNPPTTSVGDTLSFTADVSGVDKRGDQASGTMHGSCTATGVEQRIVPTCARRNPDGSCAILDPLSPLFLCQQVFRLNDSARGIDGYQPTHDSGFCSAARSRRRSA